MYRELPVEEAYHIQTGGPLIMIASVSEDGTADVMTAAWNAPFDTDQPLVVLDKSHTTSANILATGRYVICIVSDADTKSAFAAGSCKGRDVGDKFEAKGIPSRKSAKLGLKVPDGCLAYIECELKESEKSMFEKYGILVGKAVGVEADEKYWPEGAGDFREGMKHEVHHVSGSVLIRGGEITG